MHSFSCSSKMFLVLSWGVHEYVPSQHPGLSADGQHLWTAFDSQAAARTPLHDPVPGALAANMGQGG